MEFKKGDAVEVCDEKEFIKAEYFGFNDHPEVKYPHVVRLYKEDGTTEPNIYCYRNCRPDLKKDAPVWVRLVDGWIVQHFAGWTDDSRVKFWINGKTSHTVHDDTEYYTANQYAVYYQTYSHCVECYNKVSHL